MEVQVIHILLCKEYINKINKFLYIIFYVMRIILSKLKSQVQQMNNQIEFTTSCNL